MLLIKYGKDEEAFDTLERLAARCSYVSDRGVSRM
jgi:hypothetical protein